MYSRPVTSHIHSSFLSLILPSLSFSSYSVFSLFVYLQLAHILFPLSSFFLSYSTFSFSPYFVVLSLFLSTFFVSLLHTLSRKVGLKVPFSMSLTYTDVQCTPYRTPCDVGIPSVSWRNCRLPVKLKYLHSV